ncbi:hypothetical protein EVU91_07945 [Macrococcoides bohemicum]|uniref:hypothetical protein n=1 Tax=Macrococcoides bohemicum TaxID=1903056 RepID=UPI001059DEB4|nr:hypothetical protein [Macrococcus bohemicus]TDL37018.1 hypothetical protein EVU91_07945 [Macrococcus bohemicus]
MTVKELPTKTNTVTEDSQIIYTEVLYGKIGQIAKMFSLSRSTVSRYVQEASLMKEYDGINIWIAQSVNLINVKIFEKYLKEQKHKKWL